MDLEDAVLEPDDGMYWDLQRLMLAFFANEQEVWLFRSKTSASPRIRAAICKASTRRSKSTCRARTAST
jgi:hypothetical protein